MSTSPLALATLTINGQDASKHHADLMVGMVSDSMSQTITGASTYEITVADEAWTLSRSPVASTRSRLVIDKAGFTLVSVKRSRGRVTLTFEDDAVAELRTHMSLRKAAAGTTTRADFVRSLMRDVPDLRVTVAPGASKNLVELSRGSGGTNSAGQSTPVRKEDTWAAAGRIMGEVGWRVFCYRGTVTIAPDKWLLTHSGNPYTLTPTTSGVIDIDFDHDVGKPAATATVTAFAGFRDLAPGSAVKLGSTGVADGTWLVETIRRTTSSTQVTVDLVKPSPVLAEPKGSDAGGNFGIPLFLPDYLGTPAAAAGGDTSGSGSGALGTGSGRDEGVTSKADLFVRTALAQQGQQYVYGASGPDKFDCSGFTQWCAAQVGLSFPKPVSNQAARCRSRGTTLTVAQAIRTRGALLFRQRGGGANDHVVISLGDGTTIEAMGRAYGVRTGTVYGRDWTSGGYVPGMHVNIAASSSGGRAR